MKNVFPTIKQFSCFQYNLRHIFQSRVQWFNSNFGYLETKRRSNITGRTIVACVQKHFPEKCDIIVGRFTTGPNICSLFWSAKSEKVLSLYLLKLGTLWQFSSKLSSQFDHRITFAGEHEPHGFFPPVREMLPKFASAVLFYPIVCGTQLRLLWKKILRKRKIWLYRINLKTISTRTVW